MTWICSHRIICLLALWLHLFSGSYVHSQSLETQGDVRFETVSTAQGLSQSTVFSMVQDKMGFIWIGTRDGLNRYDGYDFITFKNNPQDTNSLSNNEITVIYVNAAGNLWIGTRGGGLNYYDQATDKFTRYDNLNYENIVRDIYEDQNGTLWVGTSEGLLKGSFRKDIGRYDFKNVSTTAVYKAVNGSAANKTKRVLSVISLKRFADHKLLVGVESGLYLYDKQSNQFNRIGLGESDNSIVTSTLMEPDGVLWVGTFNGLVKLSPQDKEGDSYSQTFYNDRQRGNHHLFINRVDALKPDPSGNLWVGTHGGGLVKIEPNDKVTIYRNNPFDFQSIGDNIVNSLLLDNTGVLWIGTESQGCNKLDLFRKKFAHILNLPNKTGSLSDNQVTALNGDGQGIVWVGTSNKGLDKLIYKPDEAYRVEHLNGIPVDGSSPVNEIISLYQDKDNDLWIGTASNSIVRYNAHTGFRDYFTNGYVFSIHQDRIGGIWLGT
ncbi:MAG TPA: two-component regulator propeller domain-containing protein, partial [Bacteroidales bacterium]